MGGIRKEPHSLEIGLSGAALGVGFKPFARCFSPDVPMSPGVVVWGM